MDLFDSKSQENTDTYAICFQKRSSFYEKAEKPTLGTC